jgi:hypothetical protein
LRPYKPKNKFKDGVEKIKRLLSLVIGKNYLSWLGEIKNSLFSVQGPTLRDACPSTSSGLAPQGERIKEKWLKSRILALPCFYAPKPV